MITAEECGKRRIKGIIQTYCNPFGAKVALNKTVKTIKADQMSKEKLSEIFNSLRKQHENNTRFQELESKMNEEKLI